MSFAHLENSKASDCFYKGNVALTSHNEIHLGYILQFTVSSLGQPRSSVGKARATSGLTPRKQKQQQKTLSHSTEC